jgi:glycosyltransferase involved in cell wall biosynthesis
MKILFFTDHFTPEISAPGIHIYERCKLWVEDGHKVTVVTNFPNYPLGKTYDGYKNKFRSTECLDGINVIRVCTYMSENKGSFKRTLDYISYAISSFINSLFLPKPDIVISSSPHIFVPLPAIFFSFIKRVPHVVEIRDLWPESIAGNTGISKSSFIYKTFEHIEMFIYKHSKKIIVFTNSFKRNITKRGVSQSKIEVIVNGANLDLFKTSSYDESLASSLGLKNKFVMGYIGTHGLSQGLTNAVLSSHFVCDDDIHFLFVGEGADKEKMLKEASNIKASNITFLTWQEREKMPNFWGICDVGLVHLKNDPVFKTVIPSKIFEIMACGKPIIYCGPDSDGSDILKKYNCGVCIEPDNPKMLADGLVKLKNNNKLINDLSINSKNAASDFSRKNQANKTLKVLQSAVKNANNNL